MWDNMLRVEKKFFRPIYHFFQGEEYFGTLKASSLKESARFIAEDGNYTFYRGEQTGGNYYCCLEGSSIVEAAKLNGTGLSYEVRYRSIPYRLKPGPFFHEGLELNYDLLNAEEIIGSIYQNPTRFLLNVEVGEEFPSIIQCFMFWLAYRAWVCERGWRIDFFG